MFKNILIATDGSEPASKAVEHGFALAKLIGAKVTVVTVTLPFHVFTLDPLVVQETADQYKKHMQDRATKLLGTVCSAAKAAGVACETVHVEHEHPYRAIIDAAATRTCDGLRTACRSLTAVTTLTICPWSGSIMQVELSLG
jgi:nucleotide-binding universal stress UspA family protein